MTPDMQEELRRLSELCRSTSEKFAEISKNLEPMMALIEDGASLLRVQARTHANWPELCICAECEEMRETISHIAQTVLPSSGGIERT